MWSTAFGTDLSVQYQCVIVPPTTNQIQAFFNIVNNSGSTISMKDLKLRYYYTKEGSAQEQCNIDYAVVGSSNVTRTLNNGYLEIGFTTGAGNLVNGASSGQIQVRINKTDWSSYSQADDYSFDAAKTVFSTNNKVTLYQNDVLVWGTPPNSSPVITVKVLVVDFDPILESRNGVRLHATAGWNDPQALKDQYIQDVNNASGNKVQYQIVQWQSLDEFPLYTDGFRYTDSYIDILDTARATQGNWWDYPGWHGNESIDYNHYITTLNLPGRVESGEIDEVWMFGGSRFGMYESEMVGRSAYWCNSSPIFRDDCRNFVIMGFNYERGVGEMLEDLGHRTESILTHVYGRRATQPGGIIPMNYSALNTWEKFELTSSITAFFPGSAAAVGNVHWAPNSTHDYDWGNPTIVASTCNDWKLNFPNLTGATTQVNADAWGNGDTRLHHIWWFGSMPKVAGTDSNGYLNNWWYYIMLKN